TGGVGKGRKGGVELCGSLNHLVKYWTRPPRCQDAFLFSLQGTVFRPFLKGTGFSPSVKLSKFSGALAFKGCFLNQFCFLAGFVSDSLLKTWFLKKTGFSPSV